jgi:hypothetical protein
MTTTNSNAVPLYNRSDWNMAFDSDETTSGVIAFEVWTEPRNPTPIIDDYRYIVAVVYADPFRTAAEAKDLARMIADDPGILDEREYRCMEGVVDRRCAFDLDNHSPEAIKALALAQIPLQPEDPPDRSTMLGPQAAHVLGLIRDMQKISRALKAVPVVHEHGRTKEDAARIYGEACQDVEDSVFNVQWVFLINDAVEQERKRQ